MTNPYCNLKDHKRVMLSVYIDTPDQKEQFAFTEQGLELATKMYMDHIDQIQDENEEKYTIHLMVDDGISDIEFVSPNQLTRSKLLMWRLFLKNFYYWRHL